MMLRALALLLCLQGGTALRLSPALTQQSKTALEDALRELGVRSGEKRALAARLSAIEEELVAYQGGPESAAAFEKRRRVALEAERAAAGSARARAWAARVLPGGAGSPAHASAFQQQGRYHESMSPASLRVASPLSHFETRLGRDFLAPRASPSSAPPGARARGCPPRAGSAPPAGPARDPRATLRATPSPAMGGNSSGVTFLMQLNRMQLGGVGRGSTV